MNVEQKNTILILFILSDFIRSLDENDKKLVIPMVEKYVKNELGLSALEILKNELNTND